MTPELAVAIETFRDHPDARRCETPDGARHNCSTNGQFALHCWERGVDARIVWFASSAGRVVVAWAGAFVDWSIRQFDPAAAVPHVFTTTQWLRLPCYLEPGRLGVALEDDATLLRAAGLDPLVQPPDNIVDQRMHAVLVHQRKMILVRHRLRRTYPGSGQSPQEGAR
jgi:hypothetical protein